MYVSNSVCVCVILTERDSKEKHSKEKEKSKRKHKDDVSSLSLNDAMNLLGIINQMILHISS